MRGHVYSLLILLVICSLKPELKAEGPCDNLGTLFYEDLGCTPVVPKGQKCPIKYDCGPFTRSHDECIFRSKTIKAGEVIDYNITDPICRQGCLCFAPFEEDLADFLCAILDCPEYFDPEPLDPGCYRTYDADSCCSIGQKCAPVETKCVVDGKEYLEGQRFTKDCMSCACMEGWEGKFEEPFCKRKSCLEQTSYAQEISESCAPVYVNVDSLCCPDGFLCPSDFQVVKKTQHKRASSDLSCKYGNLDVKLGEGFEAKYNYQGTTIDVSCECVLPPFVTCKGQS